MFGFLDRAGGAVIYVLIMIATVGGYIQHFITTFDDGSWFVMAIGAFLMPLGVLHGWLIWLGIV